jgi:hypothetical protein
LAIRVDDGLALMVGLVEIGRVDMHAGVRGLRGLSGGRTLSKCGRGQNHAEADEGKKFHVNLLICGMAHITSRKNQVRLFVGPGV